MARSTLQMLPQEVSSGCAQVFFLNFFILFL